MKQFIVSEIESEIEVLKHLLKAIVADNYNTELCTIAVQKAEIITRKLKSLTSDDIVQTQLKKEIPTPSTEIKSSDSIPPIIPQTTTIDEGIEITVETAISEKVTIEEITINTDDLNSVENTSPLTNEKKEEQLTVPVSDILRTDLRHFLSLNDTFRFSRELFENDSDKMNQAIHELDQKQSLNEALAFLVSITNVDEENEALTDFIDLIKKRFINS